LRPAVGGVLGVLALLLALASRDSIQQPSRG
jgi:hypothetical protein